MVQSIGDSSSQNVSNQIDWRRSQISILYIKFLGFLFSLQRNTWKRLSRPPYRESLEIFLECDLECQSSLSVFFRENIIFVTFIHIYRKHHISMYFLRKIIFHFPSEGKKNIFPHNTRKIIFKRDFFLEKLSFRAIWRKYYISIYFFWETSFIFRLKNKIIFSGK